MDLSSDTFFFLFFFQRKYIVVSLRKFHDSGRGCEAALNEGKIVQSINLQLVPKSLICVTAKDAK